MDNNYQEQTQMNTAENSPMQNTNAAPLQEKKKASSLPYILLILLLLGLLAFLFFGTSLFKSKDTDVKSTDFVDYVEEQVENNSFAPISSMEIVTLDSFPVQKQLVLKGDLANGCTYLEDPILIRDGNIFHVNLSTRQEGEVCTEALVPFEKTIALPVNGLPGGSYVVIINGKEISFELDQDNQIDFTAGEGK